MPLSSVTLTLPRMIAPAAFRRATSAASALGVTSSSAIEPAVVGSPATSIVSLTSTGMPGQRALRVAARPRRVGGRRLRRRRRG